MKASQLFYTIQGQREHFYIFLLQKHHFFKSLLQYLQLMTVTLNVLERCKCVIEQLDLRVMPDE